MVRTENYVQTMLMSMHYVQNMEMFEDDETKF